MEFSWIQKYVLLLLIRNRTARVKDLLPIGVPANQFAYHLDGLVARRLIVKLSRGTYALTPTGEKLVGTFSTALNRQAEYLKTVVMLYGKRDDEFLLFRWSRQPYLGYVTPPHDHMPRGKSLTDGVKSALDDKLGTSAPIAYRTSALIKIVHGEEVISHMNALIYQVSYDDVALPKVMRNGEVFTARPNEVSNMMGGVTDFLFLLESATEPFEVEWHY